MWYRYGYLVYRYIQGRKSMWATCNFASSAFEDAEVTIVSGDVHTAKISTACSIKMTDF